MKQVLGRTFLGGIALVAMVLGSSATSAAEQSGKIYTGGSWESAKVEDERPSGFFALLPMLEAKVTLGQVARRFLDLNAQLLNVDTDTAWGISQVVQGPELETHRMKKTWRGLPVVGGDAVIHLSNGQVTFANADSTAIRLPSSLNVRPEEARTMAYAGFRGRAWETTAPQLQVLLLGKGQERAPHLAYAVTVFDRDRMSSDVHYVDAQTGAELMVTSNVHTLVDRKVLVGLGAEEDFDAEESQWKSMYSDRGCPASSVARTETISGSPTPCAEVEERVGSSALSAWNNSGLVHQYYDQTHKRNSIDGNGMTITSVVNFGGEGFQNAGWFRDRNFMAYGLGDSDTINDFALPLDVTAHEMTHGVTSNTAALEYVSESGALNESYSDVFGKLVAFKFGKTTDWKLGKDLFRDGTSFIRDMENPKVGHYKDFKYKGQICMGWNDFCGVHTNSGIPNKAAVLLAKRIGLEKLGKIYYLTLTQLLRSSSDFAEAKAQTQAACATLFGANSADCKAVTDSFVAVGI